MDLKAFKQRAKESLLIARGDPKILTLLFLVAVALLFGLEWGLTELSDRLGGGGNYLSQTLTAGYRSYLIAMAASLVCQLVMMILWVGYDRMALALSREEEFGNGTLLEGFTLWSRCILLYVYLSALTGLWGTLVSMPASYAVTALYLAGMLTENSLMNVMTAVAAVAMLAVSYRYRMAFFILLDGPEKPIRQIVTEAKELTKTHRWQLFRMDLSFVPWVLLSALTCGVLLIWKLPYMACAYAHAYGFMLEDFRQREKKLDDLLEQQRQWLREHDMDEFSDR